MGLFLFLNSWKLELRFVYLGMEGILKITSKELMLINTLLENNFKFTLDVDNTSDDLMLLIKLGDLNLCVDINYLIFSDVIDELRFHNLSDVIDYLASI